MSDLNNVNAKLTNQLAEGLETVGMSRRERRELALRQAAEKAAAEAAAAPVAEAIEAAEEQTQDAVQAAEEKVEQVGDKVLEAAAVEDVAEGIVNIQEAKDDYDAILDEPTREFKPVSKSSLDELMEDEDEDDEEEE